MTDVTGASQRSTTALRAPSALTPLPWRVLKFGGTSVSTPERIETLIAQVRAAAQTHRVMVVVSALAGVTDALEQLVVRVLAGDADVTQATAVQRARHLDLLQASAHGGTGRVPQGKKRVGRAAITSRVDFQIATGVVVDQQVIRVQDTSATVDPYRASRVSVLRIT